MKQHGYSMFSPSCNKKINLKPFKENEMIHRTHKYATYPSLSSHALCSTQFFSYLPKSITQFFRALDGDAMLVYQHGTLNMVTRNKQKHLDFTSAIKMFSFCL